MENLLSHSRVLVTGGAGFIGSNICETLLAQDNEVICLDSFATGKRENLSSFQSHKRFQFIEGDIRDVEACKRAADGVDYVLHQAALGSVPRSVETPILTHSVNISGFLNMLVAARDAKVKRFVYASSSSVYGDHPALPKVEEQLGRPLSPYAVTKLTNEHYARTFMDLYGLECMGLRYFNVYGKRQDPDGAYAAVIPKFIKALIERRPPVIYGQGDQSRDFTFIEDVVQANQRACIAAAPALEKTVFNIAAAGRTTLNNLMSYLTELLSPYDPEISKIQAEHSSPKKGDIQHSLANIGRAQEILGYQPRYVLRSGLEKSIEWYWQYFSNARKK